MALTMGSAFGFSGVDWGASLIDRNWARSDATRQAQANELGAQRAMDFSSAEAVKNREWEEMMSNTAHQREVSDLRAAGLNPMLSVNHGASTPGGSTGQGFSAQGAPTRGTPLSGLTGTVTAAQVQNLMAQTDKTEAETEEVKARTPTHPARIEEIAQNIAESKQRIEQSVQQIANLRSGERLNDQHIANLQETISQIRATVKNLTAQTHQTYTHSGLTAAQDEETRQRIRSNLPEITRKVQELEERFRQLQLPQRGMDAAAHSSFLGALGAVGRALNPFNQLFK